MRAGRRGRINPGVGHDLKAPFINGVIRRLPVVAARAVIFEEWAENKPQMAHIV